VRVRLRWNDGQPSADLLFRGIPQKGLWAPFSFSMCMQAVVVGLGVSYLHFVALLPPDSVLEIRRDRVLDLSSDPMEPPPLTAPNLTSMDRAAPRPARAQASAAPSTTLTAPALPAQEFRMPPVRALQAVHQTLVQMDLPPTMDLHQRLLVPTIVLLASTPHRMAPRPFVAPPQRKNTMEVPSHVALEMHPPILDVRAGFAKTPEVLKETAPRLAAPVGSVAPVASNREPTEAKPAAATVTGSGAAEPSNIISLPDRPIPAASAIVLPPLNQVSARDGAAGAGGAGAGAAGPSNVQKTNPAGSGTSSAHAAAGATAARNTSAPSPGNSPANHLPGPGPGSGVLPKAVAAGPTRLIRPQNGTYEVAIVQSSGVVPGSNGMLKGKPVYSVYIPVGAGKEWILQYCLPEDEARPAARSQVVQLGNITPITAPYAFSIIGPAIQFREGARYAFIHGFVNASGRFEHLEEASDREIENIAAVLESLGQWEFRPATKDGVPAVVEILLCIPNAA